VDGAQAIDEGTGMSASGQRENARQEPQKAPSQSKYARKFGEVAAAFSSGEFLTFNSRRGGGCADLP
jgi:hypothetical protein